MDRNRNKKSVSKKVLIVLLIASGLFLGIGLMGMAFSDEPVVKSVVEDKRTPLEQVRDNAGVDGLKLTKEGSEITAVFPVSDNLSNEMIVTGARIDSKTVVKALKGSSIKYKGLNISGTFDLIDSNGKELKDKEVYYLYFPKETIDKMYPDNLTAEAFAELADMEVIHPAFGI